MITGSLYNQFYPENRGCLPTISLSSAHFLMPYMLYSWERRAVAAAAQELNCTVLGTARHDAPDLSMHYCSMLRPRPLGGCRQRQELIWDPISQCNANGKSPPQFTSTSHRCHEIASSSRQATANRYRGNAPCPSAMPLHPCPQPKLHAASSTAAERPHSWWLMSSYQLPRLVSSRQPKSPSM